MEERTLKESFTDDMFVQPSQNHRIRNTLTLEERVYVIKAYDRVPMYSKVAKMFNCCWEQIRNIIANRSAIMDCYEATIENEQMKKLPTITLKLSEKELLRNKLQQLKVDFLNKCLFELILRVNYYQRMPITAVFIQSRAVEFCTLIEIKNFLPNKVWLYNFLNKHNLRLPIRHRMATKEVQQTNFELKEIISFCSKTAEGLRLYRAKHPGTATGRIDLSNRSAYAPVQSKCLEQNNHQLAYQPQQLSQRRLHQSTPQPRCKLLQSQPQLVHTPSSDLNSLRQQPLQPQLQHKPQLQQLDKKRQADISVLSPLVNIIPNDNKRLQEFRRTQCQMNFLEKALYEYIQRKRLYRNPLLDDEKLKRVASELCAILNIKNFTPTNGWLQHFKSRYDFSATTEEPHKAAPKSLDLVHILKYCSRHENKNHTLASLKLQPTRKRSHPDGMAIVTVAGYKDKDVNANEIVSSSVTTDDCKSTPIKVRRLEAILHPSRNGEHINTKQVQQQITEKANKPQQQTQSLIKQPKPEQNVAQTNLNTYAEALAYLKPLEEFAMLQDNYRAVGILSQLESIFRNSPP